MKWIWMLFFCAFAVAVHAQNYVGYSKAEIRAALKNDGEHYNEDKTTNGVAFFSIENRIEQTYKIYYFDSDNLCSRYVIFYKDREYKEIAKALSETYKKFKDKWYDKETEVAIEFDEDLKGYLVRFDPYEP